jgi:microcystin-dependent protein
MRKSVLSLPLALTVAAGIGFSTESMACSSEPYIGSLCIMAWPKNSSFSGTYMAANGTVLNIVNYQALYALIGATYGGNGTTTFALPNLSGRVVIGTGTNPDTGLTYGYQNQRGTGRITLTAAQAPLATHSHTLNAGATKPVTATVTLGNMAATTTLSGLSATTSLSGVTASADGTKLNFQVSSAGVGTGTPATGSALGNAGGTRIYVASATPSVVMAANSITGNAPVTFAGNPTTTVTGTPSTTLSGLPTVAIGGSTDPMGGSGSQAVDTLPPYLALTYYIAVSGVFPTPD